MIETMELIRSQSADILSEEALQRLYDIAAARPDSFSFAAAVDIYALGYYYGGLRDGVKMIEIRGGEIGLDESFLRYATCEEMQALHDICTAISARAEGLHDKSKSIIQEAGTA